MKRGRPAMREQFRREILTVLAENHYPVTVTAVRRFVDTYRGRTSGWDTIQKYLEELVSERLVLRQPLPVRHGRKPLVVYLGRQRRDRPDQ